MKNRHMSDGSDHCYGPAESSHSQHTHAHTPEPSAVGSGLQSNCSGCHYESATRLAVKQWERWKAAVQKQQEQQQQERQQQEHEKSTDGEVGVHTTRS